MTATDEMVNQIEEVLKQHAALVGRSQYDDLSDLQAESKALANRLQALLDRIAPPGSTYGKAAEAVRSEPAHVKIAELVGPYNPDWAIIKQEDGEDRIYMIRETKSTLDDAKLRPSELARIKSAKKHFAAIGIDDYGRSVPEKWNL